MKGMLTNDKYTDDISNNFIQQNDNYNDIDTTELMQLKKDMYELKDICHTLNDMTNIQENNINLIETNTENTTENLGLVENNMTSVTKTVSSIKKKVFVGSGIVATIGTLVTGSWFAFPIIGISAVTIGMTYVKIK